MEQYQPNPDASDAERLVTLEIIMCDMHKRLFGNGQPGELAELRKRVGALETWFWRTTGAAAVVIFAIERFGR